MREAQQDDLPPGEGAHLLCADRAPARWEWEEEHTEGEWHVCFG